MPKSFTKLAIPLLVLATLPACTVAPVPIGHVIHLQKGNVSVYHWEVLADKVASDINQKLGGYAAKDESRSVVIAPVNSASPFASVYRDKLEEALLSHNITATTSQNSSSYVVHTSINIVRHAVENQPYQPDNNPFLRDSPEAQEAKAKAYKKDTEFAELVVTSKLVAGNKTVLMRTDNY